MTLIIGSIRSKDVILTADGRSTVTNHGRVVNTDDHFQKLFPVPHHPVVIAQMGENLLNGKPLPVFIGEFIQQLNTGNLTILQIMDELRQYVHPAIRARLQSLEHPLFDCNFWVAGFSAMEKSPSMIEVFWKLKDNVLLTEERRFLPIAVVPGGDGKNQIEKVDWHKVEGKSVDQVRAYHGTLMNEAMTAKINPNTVGGDICEVVITPVEWRWTKAPRRSTDPTPGGAAQLNKEP